MPASQIAAQMYTLRDHTKTPVDIARTLARVRAIGYQAVQLSALGPIDPAELAKILRNEGLAVAATHTSPERLDTDTQRVIDEHHAWGCALTAIGGYFKETQSAKDWNDFAASFNRIAGKFAGSGVAVGYHNHSHELVRYDGKTALQHLTELLDQPIWFEIDTYWIAHGGGDPRAWISALTGRVPAVHLKDMSINQKREQKMAEVGEGNLNWPGILQACKDAGTQWYIVEQDDCNGLDPFDCLATSLRNLKAMGLN